MKAASWLRGCFQRLALEMAHAMKDTLKELHRQFTRPTLKFWATYVGLIAYFGLVIWGLSDLNAFG